MIAMRDTPWSLVENTAPSEEPVSLSEAKGFANVSITGDDSLIEALITTARKVGEAMALRQFVNATYDLYLDVFPSVIELPKPPLSSVTHVKYYDTNGDLQTLTVNTDYQVDTYSTPGRIVPGVDAVDWPSTEAGKVAAVTVQYVAGYGAASAVPEHYKTAIKMLVTHWYESRRPVSTLTMNEVPFAMTQIFMQDRGVWLF